MDWSLIIVALAGLVGTTISAGVGYLRWLDERRHRNQAELEMRFTRAALQFPEFVEEWDEIIKDIMSLMDETNVERFLILRAWNGHLEPRWTTAIYQLRSNGHKPIAYVHFELDADYVGMLKQVTVKNNVYLETDLLPKDSALRYVYENEGVQSAFISHLVTLVGEHEDSFSQTYCSFGSHSGPLSQNTITRCRIIANRMKGLASTFGSEKLGLGKIEN